MCAQLGLPPRWLDHLRAEHAAAAAGGRRRRRQLTRVHSVQEAAAAQMGDGAAEESAWQDQLTGTDRCIIHLARALVTAPHVLILHRPLASLDEDVAKRVLAALRRFITMRSLFSDTSPAALLSRTVIFSTSTLDERALDAVDDVIVVGTPHGGASLLSAHQDQAPATAQQCATGHKPAARASSVVGPVTTADAAGVAGASRSNLLRDLCSDEAQASAIGASTPEEDGSMRRFNAAAHRWKLAGARFNIIQRAITDVDHAEALVQRAKTRSHQRCKTRKASIDVASLL